VFGSTRERAHGGAGAQKFVDHESADAASGACHENCALA
jgi:hypothetical protein